MTSEFLGGKDVHGNRLALFQVEYCTVLRLLVNQVNEIWNKHTFISASAFSVTPDHSPPGIIDGTLSNRHQKYPQEHNLLRSIQIGMQGYSDHHQCRATSILPKLSYC